MEVNIQRQSGLYHLRSTNSEGRFVETDGSEAIGGTNKGVRPMEMVLMSLGSCSAIDVIKILNKAKQDLKDIKVNIKAQRDHEAVPALFTHIDIHYVLIGDISPKKAERAVDLSINKYCSVAQILKHTATIGYSYEIVKESNQ